MKKSIKISAAILCITAFCPCFCFSRQEPEFLTDSLTAAGSVKRGDKIRIKGFYFDDGGSAVNDGLKKYLKNIAAEIKKIKYAKIYIDGYTDNRGGNSANNRLARTRAEKIKKELAENGIPARKMQARAYGSIRPIASNETKAGRIQNRRIEIIIK